MESFSDKIKIHDLEKITDQICDFIKDEISNNFQKSGAVVGLSGGIDSTITAALCSRSLNSENVLGIIMPEKESDPTSEKHAKDVAQHYKINTNVIDITSILESFGVYQNKENIIKEKFSDFNVDCKYRLVVPSKLQNSIGMPFLEILDDSNKSHKLKISTSEFLTLTAATSIKHRVRMTILYFHAEKYNYCVVGTTNKSEYLQGYFVKYGDGGADIDPLVSLYKSQIYQIGNFLEIPNTILSKDASPDVWSYTTTDQDFFYSVPYDTVDLILYAQENNLSIQEIQKLSNLSEENIVKLMKVHEQKYKKSQHMREIPHALKPIFTQ